MNIASSPVQAPEQYVLLRADDLRLLLPSTDVGPAEHFSGLLEPLDGSGLLCNPADPEGAAFYVALSSSMKPLPEAPVDRFLTTTLGDSGASLRWCWSEVRMLASSAVTPQPLPQALRAPYSPIAEFTVFEDHIVFFCDAARVADFVFAHRT
ncbi:MAG: hypothetical protein Q4G70_03055 [Pseudomonadota bacterium]|nr:hypothetical protein [Pseudomonadota bacterium]